MLFLTPTFFFWNYYFSLKSLLVDKTLFSPRIRYKEIFVQIFIYLDL